MNIHYTFDVINNVERYGDLKEGDLFTFVDEYLAMSHASKVFVKSKDGRYRSILSQIDIKGRPDNTKVYKVSG